MCTRLLFCFLACRLLVAAADLAPLAALPDLESLYVCLDLSAEANAGGGPAFAAPLLTAGKVPLRLVRAEGRDQVFLRPLGWAAATDESKEYAGYMAGYDGAPDAADPTRAMLLAPVDDYAAAWLLAATDDDAALNDVLTLRIGRFGKSGRTDYADFSVRVPRTGDAEAGRGGTVAAVYPTAQGNVYLIRLPIARGFRQEFADDRALHVEITGELGLAVNQPDPYRYQVRPVGDPSGVRLYALTLERSPVSLAVVGAEPGNVYNQPQLPSFDVTLTNHATTVALRLEVWTRRDDGEEALFTVDEVKMAAANRRTPMLRLRQELELREPGHYAVEFRVYRKNDLLTRRATTLALLAPDTRQHRATGPFGTWNFDGKHITPTDTELMASLALKAGWRYLMESPEQGLVDYADYHLARKEGWQKLVAARDAALAAGEPWNRPQRGLIFHETSISGSHVLRTPDVFTDRPYTLTERDQQRFDQLWEEAMDAYAGAQANFPDMPILFGNGMPHLVEAFCQRGIRRDYLTLAGNESGSFMRPPETQPCDFVANNAGLYMFRAVLDHYGYTDTRLQQCYEVSYPATNPGNLSEATQARYSVRNILHSLAWGIDKITPGMLADIGSSYYGSNWGAAGFCHAYPQVTPKPAYVAYAVLTQALDGAVYAGPLDTGSPVVYALAFTRPDGGSVTALWTTRGRRPARLSLPAAAAAAPVLCTDMYGRTRPLPVRDGQVALDISADVCYLAGAAAPTAVSLGAPVHGPGPLAADSQLIDPLSRLADWTVETGRSYELETYNFMSPRRPGDFAYRQIDHLDGRVDVIGVRPRPVLGNAHMRMYGSLRLNHPVTLRDRPTEIGLWVHGNGGWGRVIFELTDAAGQRWISIGAEMAGAPNPWMADWMPAEEFAKLQSSARAGISSWNSNDAWGQSYVNHEGWRYLRFPLPGNYGRAADGYHWPRNSQWRADGDSRVHYPLTFTRLILTFPENVLTLNRFAPVADPEIAISALQVSYRPLADVVAEE